MQYDREWFNSLEKPKNQPPAWVFAPVWFFLYSLMVVSLILVILSPFRILSLFAYLFFALQLIVNFQWAPAFFKEHNLRKAFIISVLLTLLVFITMIIFYQVSKIAGVMFLPYFLWCCFANYLMFEILELNEW